MTAPAPRLFWTPTEDGHDGPAVACFGYAYGPKGHYFDERAHGFNPALTAAVAEANSRGALPAFLAELSGVFGGWCLAGGRLEVFSDQLGFRPIYVYEAGGRVGVAPRQAPIKAEVALTLDGALLPFYLAHGHFPGSLTAFAELHQVWGGNVYARTRTGGWSERAYVDWGFAGADAALAPDVVLGGAIERLRHGVGLALANAPRLALPLSGGLDSRMLAFAIPEPLRAGVLAVNYGDPTSSDARYARAVA